MIGLSASDPKIYTLPSLINLNVATTGIGTVVTSLAPASNTNGIIIYSILGIILADADGTIFCDTSAPLSFNDFTKRMIARCISGSTANYERTTIPLPVFVPAGNGIYCVRGGGGNAPQWSLQYRAL